MSGQSAFEKAKGRLKEAVGDLLGDKDKQSEGSAQQEKAEAHEEAEQKQAEAREAEAEAAKEEARQERQG